VVSGEREGQPVRLGGQGQCGIKRVVDVIENKFDVGPISSLLLAQHIHQLIQDLCADRTACGDEVL
jgi:hypothetical protein